MAKCKVCGMGFVNEKGRDHHINLRHLRLYGENDYIKLLDNLAIKKGFNNKILTKEELDKIPEID